MIWQKQDLLDLIPAKCDICISIVVMNGRDGKITQSQGLVQIPKTSPLKPPLTIQKLQVLWNVDKCIYPSMKKPKSEKLSNGKPWVWTFVLNFSFPYTRTIIIKEKYMSALGDYSTSMTKYFRHQDNKTQRLILTNSFAFCYCAFVAIFLV